MRRTTAPTATCGKAATHPGRSRMRPTALPGSLEAMSITVRQRSRGRIPAAGRHYLPDLVYGANAGIITPSGVAGGGVGATLSVSVILTLGFPNLAADGFSRGASTFRARRPSAGGAERADGRGALRHGSA